MQKPEKKKSDEQSNTKQKRHKVTDVTPDKNQERAEETKYGGIPERDFRKNLGCG